MEKIYLDFDNVMKKLTLDEREKFLDWIAAKWIDLDTIVDEDSKTNEDGGVGKLRFIAANLRDKVPFCGNQIINQNNALMGKDLKTGKLFVDEFIYDDEDLKKLRKQHSLADHYCSDCGSSNIKQFELVSHSCSIERIELIFEELLGSLEGKTVLDVGSGVGALLYGAHVLSNASKIVGVEVDTQLSQLCQQTLSLHKMTERVAVVNADIASQPHLIKEADVVFVCNTFEYFLDTKAAINCWRVIYENISSGAVLVLSPPADPTFLAYPIGVEWKDWLKELPLNRKTVQSLRPLASIAAYTVLDGKPSTPTPQA